MCPAMKSWPDPRFFDFVTLLPCYLCHAMHCKLQLKNLCRANTKGIKLLEMGRIRQRYSLKDDEICLYTY